MSNSIPYKQLAEVLDTPAWLLKDIDESQNVDLAKALRSDYAALTKSDTVRPGVMSIGTAEWLLEQLKKAIDEAKRWEHGSTPITVPFSNLPEADSVTFVVAP